MIQRQPLRQQILLSYIPVIIIPILLIGIVMRVATEYGLRQLAIQEAQGNSQVVAQILGSYYERMGSFNKLINLSGQQLFKEINLETRFLDMRNHMDRANDCPPNDSNCDNNNNQPLNGSIRNTLQASEFVIVDTIGRVIAASSQQTLQQTFDADLLNTSQPITVNNTVVGRVLVGGMLGRLDSQKRQLLIWVNRILFIGGGTAIILAVLASWWLSSRISAPLNTLMQGVRQLRAGQWHTPLVIHQPNELGDLTQAFNEMAEDLTRQEQLRRQMIADIAHDLRTPLSVMTLEVEAISAGMQTPEQATNSLREEIDWLRHMIDDLHTLSTLDAGKLELMCEPTEPRVLLNNIYRHWDAMAVQEQRAFTVDIAPNLPLISVDRFRMQQVLGNLISNAFQHTPPTAAIRLGAARVDNHILLTVQDEGAGIPAQDLPHIFDRFYRADKSRKHVRRGGGSGLGLSIARQLTALHGGQLTVQSQAGRGTTFIVSLPIAA